MVAASEGHDPLTIRTHYPHTLLTHDCVLSLSIHLLLSIRSLMDAHYTGHMQTALVILQAGHSLLGRCSLVIGSLAIYWQIAHTLLHAHYSFTGADVSAVDNVGNSALDIATEVTIHSRFHCVHVPDHCPLTIRSL